MSRLETPARVALALPLLLALTAASGAVPGAERPAQLVERSYQMTRRPAAAAVDQVCPLLSAEGSVSVRDGGRTLVVRDVEPIVERAMKLVADFDRGGRTLRVAVQIVSADASGPAPTAAGGATAIELPAEVVERLHRLLRYRSYSLLARAELEAPEEAVSTFEGGPDYRVSFRLDRQGSAERVRMSEFRVLRKSGHGDLRPLVHTHLSLEMGRPMILGLAPTEASERALVVVLEAGPGAVAGADAAAEVGEAQG